jgi:acyl carrier protein
MSNPLRICLWSGPRNVSTALMYAFSMRGDTRVVDEPLYAHYLRLSGAEHPGRREVLASMENDGEEVVRGLILGPCDRPVLFMKQMAHHLLGLDRGRVRAKRRGVRARLSGRVSLGSTWGGRVPQYMIPQQFVVLESLPLTPNGKVDRRALPEPGALQGEDEEVGVSPRTPVEEQLAEIWSQVLGIPRVGVHDNFFELGGHSLNATQVVSRIHKECHAQVRVRDLFSAPTVAGLTRLLGQAAADPGLRITDIELSEGPAPAHAQAEIPIELNF